MGRRPIVRRERWGLSQIACKAFDTLIWSEERLDLVPRFAGSTLGDRWSSARETGGGAGGDMSGMTVNRRYRGNGCRFGRLCYKMWVVNYAAR
jgi:hypothetical protein